MRKIKLLSLILVLLFSNMAMADEVRDLLDYYVNEFHPEKALLLIDAKPDSTGLFNDIYLDLQGVMIEHLRLNSLTVRMKAVQFNEPSQWAKGNVECKDAIQILARAVLLEDDINRSIQDQTFGDDDNTWHDLSLKINPNGLSGRGYYELRSPLHLDILIEIASGLRIVKGKELWLKDPQVKINRMDLPDYVTRKALNQIQPLVDLRKFPLPLTLHKVDLQKGRATLSTRTLPQEIQGGIKYTYQK